MSNENPLHTPFSQPKLMTFCSLSLSQAAGSIQIEGALPGHTTRSRADPAD